MAKITIEELSGSLKEYLNGLGLTEAQVQELIDKFEDGKIGDINQLSTENKTIVEGINEVKKSVDNKDLSDYQLIKDTSLLTNNKTIVEAINEIYTTQDTVKQELVAALLAKGLEATTNMNFNELVGQISGLISHGGTAVASDVISGKTFINSTGNLITGTMTNHGSKSITPTRGRQTLPEGYYSGITINGDSNLVPENIQKGITIFGVTGSYPSDIVCVLNSSYLPFKMDKASSDYSLSMYLSQSKYWSSRDSFPTGWKAKSATMTFTNFRIYDSLIEGNGNITFQQNELTLKTTDSNNNYYPFGTSGPQQIGISLSGNNVLKIYIGYALWRVEADKVQVTYHKYYV